MNLPPVIDRIPRRRAVRQTGPASRPAAAGAHVEADAAAGFTLIELLTVVAIIGILAGIAIAIFAGQRTKAEDATARSDVRNIANLEESYLASGTGNSYGTATQLAGQQRLPASPNSTVWVYTKSSMGYCLVGHNASSASYVVYDSQRGGLRSAPYTTLTAAKSACTGAGYVAAGTVSNTNGSVTTN